ncbi:hypothetical protein B5C26_21655 [Photorhabdus luminescens]|uniref:class I SAM-dependent methyltransferase n=1 Tax=Photorhabdus luminescens TaxID=29488 RepID=UPI000B4DB4F8|nr:class I SAM-dependent methyltransferase [Photorhabdus luminescens]OWO79179.1 hypothetical protein B5C26_21655 [Photorhabdus luminescens]
MKDNTLYGPIAHLYESFSDATDHIKVEIRTIFNLAGDIHGKSVLDLACGYGLFSREYRNRGALKVIGVDISENMIAIAKSKSQQYGDDIEFIPPSPFTMYRWSREQYQTAIQKAGFKQFKWQKPMLLESDIEAHPLGFWDDYQRNCLDTALVCQI